MLGWWATLAWRRSQKNIGHQLLSGLIQQQIRCMWCDAEFATNIVEHEMEMCVPKDRLMNCPHLRENSIKEILCDCGDNRDRVVDFLEWCLPSTLSCNAAKHIIVAVLGKVAADIDTTVQEDHQELPAHKVGIRKSSSGRNEDAVRHVPLPRHAGVMTERKGKVGKAILFADGNDPSMYVRWTRKDVCSYFTAACRVLHNSTGTFGFYWDGAQVREACQGILRVPIVQSRGGSWSSSTAAGLCWSTRDHSMERPSVGL